MFHFIGQAHACKACTKAEALQEKRIKAIGNMVFELQKHTGEIYPITAGNIPESHHTIRRDSADPVPAVQTCIVETEALNKKERKKIKRAFKAQEREPILNQAGIENIKRIMYHEGTPEVRETLYAKLCSPKGTTVFSDKKVMDTIFNRAKKAPDFEKGAARIMTTLQIIELPADKTAKSLCNEIKKAIIEELKSSWNAEVEMRRRRAIYTIWVSNGAVDRSIQSSEVCHSA